MNYTEYDKIQIDAGGIGDNFKSTMHQIINLSDATPETKELVQKTCEQISNSLNELAILVSQTAKLMTK